MRFSVVANASVVLVVIFIGSHSIYTIILIMNISFVYLADRPGWAMRYAWMNTNTQIAI